MDLLDLCPKKSTHNGSIHYYQNIISLPITGLIKELHVRKIRRKHVSALLKWLDANPQIENLSLNISDSETISRFINYTKSHPYLAITFAISSRLKLDLTTIFCIPNHLRRLVLENVFLAEPWSTKHLIGFITHSRHLRQLFLHHCDLFYTFKNTLARALLQSQMEELKIISCKIIYLKNFKEGTMSLLNAIAHSRNLGIVNISNNDDLINEKLEVFQNVVFVADKLTSLTLTSIHLNDSALQCLVSILSLNRITYLKLDRVTFSSALDNRFTEALAANSSIVHLHVQYEKLLAVFQALISNRSIAFLEVDDNMTLEKSHTLAIMITKTTSIQRLRLCNYVMTSTPERTEVIINALKHNRTIKYLEFSYVPHWLIENPVLFSILEHQTFIEFLELSFNSDILLPEATRLLAQALKHNSTLKVLKIHHYFIYGTSQKTILDALAYNSTLEVLEIYLILHYGHTYRPSFTWENPFEFLKYNSSLRILKIPLSITTSVCNSLATALRFNNALEELYLDGIETFDPFFEAFQYNSTLCVFSTEIYNQYPSILSQLINFNLHNPGIKLKLGSDYESTNTQSPDALTKISANKYIMTHRNLPLREIIPDEVADHLLNTSNEQGLMRFF